MSDHPRTLEQEMIDALARELSRWRGWAQFVFLNGGPVKLTDDELRAAVCEKYDKDVADAKSASGSGPR